MHRNWVLFCSLHSFSKGSRETEGVEGLHTWFVGPEMNLPLLGQKLGYDFFTLDSINMKQQHL